MISNIRKLGALMMVLGSCSFAMRGPDPEWDGKQEPVCSDSYTPVMVDGFTASVVAGTVAQLAEDGEPPLDTSVVVGAVALSLVYTVSAGIGASRYNECRAAKADWYVREALRESSAKAGAAPSSPAATTVPPGYFCTSSPSRPQLGICLRQRAACEHARRVLATPDSEDCAPLKVAWCFNIDGKSRCFATQHACEARIATATAVSGACTERS